MPKPIKDSLEKTLILGASVSAAPLDRNPSKLYLKSKGLLNSSVSYAFDGHPGARVISTLSKSLLDRVSAVIAIDLMFWDSVMGLADPRESKAFLRGFFKELAKRKLPILIGNVPGFHGLQLNRDEINHAIERECAEYAGGQVLHLDRLFDKVLAEGGVLVEGRRHTIRELLPDGLHPGPLAAQVISRAIHDTIHGIDHDTIHGIEYSEEVVAKDA